MNDKDDKALKSNVFAMTADLRQKTGIKLDPEEIWTEIQRLKARG